MISKFDMKIEVGHSNRGGARFSRYSELGVTCGWFFSKACICYVLPMLIMIVMKMAKLYVFYVHFVIFIHILSHRKS